jgi:hypothetical protein
VRAHPFVLALAGALALAAAPAAWADGDPASDILPAQDVYYPYTPPVSKSLVTAFDRELKQVRAAGYPFKVAVLASQGDMGSYPTLFDQPQRYADLLSSELPTQSDRQLHGAFHLLVVMPGGFGGQNLGDKVDQALAPIKIDPAAGSDGLVRAAMQAVARIATAAGHPTKVPPEATAASSKPGAGGKGGGTSAAAIFIPIAAVLIALTAIVLVRRRRVA